MENKEKYYTPSIEEFHIGFEFEEEFKNYNYNKLVKPMVDTYDFISLKLDTSHSISRITSKINKNKVRVKYLDKADIESLGFRKCSEDEYAWTWGGFYIKEVTEDSVFTIRYNKSANLWGLAITSKYDYEGHDILYFSIKNKSELKKLLTQLNIK